MQVHLFEERSS